MATDGSRARDLRAVYAFRGPPEELNRTLPLDVGECVILEGTLLVYSSPLFQRVSYVRLTSDRFALLRHYGWRPDTVTEVPPRALRKVDRVGARLEMTWTGHDGRISLVCPPLCDCGVITGMAQAPDPLRRKDFGGHGAGSITLQSHKGVCLTPWAMPNAWPSAFANLDQLTSDLRAWLSSVG